MSSKRYCSNCGNEISVQAGFCSSCGASQGNNSDLAKKQQRKEVNSVLAAILGYMLPGLPSIIWFNQKIKGVVMLLVTIISFFISPIITIVIGILSVIDAYQLSKRVNDGEVLDEWIFFWDK